MAAAKKKGLPEITVSATENADLVTIAKNALALRTQISALEAQLTEAKKELADKAKVLRATKEATGSYIGLIRIIDGEQTPAQVQFKIMNGSLALADKPTLEAALGSACNFLFAEDMAGDEILNPNALLDEVRGKNVDPWTVLELRVKKGMDALLKDSPNISKAEVLMPREGFLATCNEFAHTFLDSAKQLLAGYLDKVLTVAVDLGKK